MFIKQIHYFHPRILVVLGIALLMAVAQPGKGEAAETPPVVVASIRPVHALVAGVMAGVGAPVLLVGGGTSPHDVALRPSEARWLTRAHLLFWIGPNLEAFLVKTRALLPSGGQAVALGTVEGIHHRSLRSGGVWNSKGKETGEKEQDDHQGNHDHERGNPHVWLDPANVRVMVRAISAALIKIDPAHDEAYRRNARRMDERLTALEAELFAQLTPVRERSFLVLHDAFAHFEHRFELKALGAVTVTPSHKPGARRMMNLRRAVKAAGATCIFTEPQANDRLPRLLAEGTGSRIGVLDPIGLGLRPGEDLYFSLMRNLAENFVQCLGTP